MIVKKNINIKFNKMATVYLALGSNMGDRPANIQKAIELLNSSKITVKKISSIIETEPAGGPPQDKYLNGVIEVTTTLTPFELLKTAQSIEKKLGRKKTVCNAPRPIDIDILFYDQKKIQTPELTIPHPRMLNREFVMRPLSEIAPDLVNELTHARR